MLTSHGAPPPEGGWDTWLRDAVARDSNSEPSPGAALDVSPTPRGDGVPSPTPRGDGSSLGAVADVGVHPRLCLWCRRPLEPTQERWCGKKCRQTAWRARRLAVAEGLGDVDIAGRGERLAPKRLAYADPPYPGLSRKYYRDEPNYAGEVDHRELVASLMERYDGWALSTSSKALRDVLPLCPPDARVAAWGKLGGVSSKTRGPHSRWEPVIYVPARVRRPGLRDWLQAHPARGGGSLMGRKPLVFCAWVFALLGAEPIDELDDLFPGTGVVSKAWEQFRTLSPTPASATPAEARCSSSSGRNDGER